jgi:hypothetical protein
MQSLFIISPNGYVALALALSGASARGGSSLALAAPAD